MVAFGFAFVGRVPLTTCRNRGAGNVTGPCHPLSPRLAPADVPWPWIRLPWEILRARLGDRPLPSDYVLVDPASS